MIQQRLFILALTVILMAQASPARAMSCQVTAEEGADRALIISPLTESVSIRTKVETPEADLRASIDDLKARFLKPPTKSWKLVTNNGRKLYDSLTAIMSRFQSRSYPFSYISEGVVPRIRIWAKIADDETTNTVNQWMSRYESYQMSRRLRIERAVFARAQNDLLEKLLSRPDSDFPVEAKIARYIRKGLQSETKVFLSKAQVKRALKQLRATESLSFDSITGLYFSKGWFLRGRDYEQAHIEAQLKIVLAELQRNALALKDPTLRQQMINKVQALLDNPDLLSTTGARYVESRRAFTAEINYFKGKRELSTSAAALLEDGVWGDDLFDLGVDNERIGPINRFLRASLVHSPKILAATALFMYAPALKYEAKVHLARETLMHEIAAKPQAQYEQQSYEFLKVAYGTHKVGEESVLNAGAGEAMTHLRELRNEHLKELREEKISEQEYALSLDGPPLQSPVSPAEFKVLMELHIDKFAAAAKAVSAEKAAPSARAALYQRLAESYIDIHQAPTAQSEEASGVRHLSSDQVVDSFTGFITGGAGEAESKEE